MCGLLLKISKKRSELGTPTIIYKKGNFCEFVNTFHASHRCEFWKGQLHIPQGPSLSFNVPNTFGVGRESQISIHIRLRLHLFLKLPQT